jgi:tetratricopeptide (TPR) repeat protein
MAEEDELLNPEAGENYMLREAIDALRQGDRSRARDLLTRLLKADQKNATYWVWMSAAVDSQKERIYCLQSALKIDPTSAAARRGLILLGTLPPAPDVPPFPLNHPRSWEQAFQLPSTHVERPGGWANPFVRLIALIGASALVIALFVGGYSLFGSIASRPEVYVTPTHRPTFTLTLTPSLTPLVRTATPTFLGPTPLAYFLPATYTKTPLYVLTEHPVLTSSSFDAGLRFLAAGQYETARVQFEQVLDSEPQAVDAWYFIGETYRLEENYDNARSAYQEAINLNSGFAPAFVGRALANLGLNPKADVLADFDNAVALDAQYPDAYIQRGAYLVAHGQPAVAVRDLQIAIELSPESGVAWMGLAQAQMAAGDGQAALESALHANQLDLTLVPVYLTLAQAYIATGHSELAVAVLQTYTIYEPDEVSAFLALGTAYNAAGDYQEAVGVLSRYLDSYPRDAEAYFQRGLAYLNLDSPNLAEADFKKAVGYDPLDFDSQLGLARAYFDQGKPRDAYVQAETKALPLAHTDLTKAQVYYWSATFLEEIGDATSLQAAKNNWNKLVALPVDVMPAEWLTAAWEHLGITPTFTPTRTP